MQYVVIILLTFALLISLNFAYVMYTVFESFDAFYMDISAAFYVFGLFNLVLRLSYLGHKLYILSVKICTEKYCLMDISMAESKDFCCGINYCSASIVTEQIYSWIGIHLC